MEEGCGGVGVLTRLGRGQKRRRAGLCAGLGMQGPQKPRADSLGRRHWPRADLHRARITRKFVCGGGGGGGGGGGIA